MNYILLPACYVYSVHIQYMMYARKSNYAGVVSGCNSPNKESRVDFPCLGIFIVMKAAICPLVKIEGLVCFIIYLLKGSLKPLYESINQWEKDICECSLIIRYRQQQDDSNLAACFPGSPLNLHWTKRRFQKAVLETKHVDC